MKGKCKKKNYFCKRQTKTTTSLVCQLSLEIERFSIHCHNHKLLIRMQAVKFLDKAAN